VAFNTDLLTPAAPFIITTVNTIVCARNDTGTYRMGIFLATTTGFTTFTFFDACGTVPRVVLVCNVETLSGCAFFGEACWMINSRTSIAAHYVAYSVAVIAIIEVTIVSECVLNVGFTIVSYCCGLWLFGKDFIWTMRNASDGSGSLDRSAA